MKRMEFKERFKGKTSLMGKDGPIGVVASASKPINITEESESSRSYRPMPRHKRAISQDYTFEMDFAENNQQKYMARSSDLKKRKSSKKNNHTSLTEAGSSILGSRSIMNEMEAKDVLNRSIQPIHYKSISHDRVS